jgi:hypothetical protein
MSFFGGVMSDPLGTEYVHPSNEIILHLDLADPEEREASIWVRADNETDARAILTKYEAWLNESLGKHDLSTFDAQENDAQASDDPSDPGFVFFLEFPPVD